MMNSVVELLVLGALGALTYAFVRCTLRVQHLQAEYDRQTQAIRRLQGEMRALLSGSAGVSGHLGQVERQIRRLAERQETLELREPAQSYEHAIKMARSGASVGELIAQCGLVREEAELLVRMYGLEKAS